MAGIPKGKAALETLHINEKKWSKELMDAADYVNVISSSKHPWQKGIVARKGIEY